MTPFGSLAKEARVALQIGAAEARELQHAYLGVEHLVIGLCKVVDSDLGAILPAAGFDPRTFRRHLRRKLGHGHEPVGGAQLAITPRLTEVMRLAEAIAKACDEGSVRPLHLLLAVLVEGRSAPMRAFQSLGWDTEGLKARLVKSLCEPGTFRPASAHTPVLDSLGRDLTALAREGKLPPVVGRKPELLAVARALSRQTRNNPLLVGEAGVGKTCIVEALARRSVQEDAPEPLRGKRIVEIPIAALVAGAKYRGDFEERLQTLIRETASDSNVILFLDEIHSLMGAGAAGSGALDAANILKPALARGEIRCIGATTVQEYRRHIEKDAALARRFEVVWVEEPTPAETLEILVGIRPSLEQHHGVRITDDALSEAVRLTGRHVTDRRFPDKAVAALDRACAEIRLQSLTVHKGDPSLPAVNGDIVARVVSADTRIPLGALTRGEADVLLGLGGALRRRVVGQDDAISRVVETVIAGRQLHSGHRPKGVFLFLGQTGVGKTEFAKALAASLFGSEGSMIRLDMSEYMERHAVLRLIGAPPSYLGHEEEGQLTGAVRRRPYSVVLLDEIEKAHPDVLNLFLQVLDDGRLTDSRGQVADFTNTLVIMTSNVGADALPIGGRGLGFRGERAADFAPEGPADGDVLRQAARRCFTPELLNRIDEIVPFRPLGKDSLGAIADLLIEEVAQQLAERQLSLDVSPEARSLLIAQGFRQEYGARELRRAVDQLLRKPLAGFLLTAGPPPGATIRAVRSEGRLLFESLGRRPGEAHES